MKIVIYQTSDLHGFVYPTNYVSDQDLGILKIGSYILQNEKNYDASLKIDCGDLIQGSAFAHYLSKQSIKDSHILQALEAIDYDVYVLGNHEFNYGLDYLHNSYEFVSNKILNANIEGLPFDTLPYKIFNFDGFKIGCIGLTTSFIPNWENRDNIKNLKFLNPVECYRKYENELVNKCDFIVVCYHGGFEKSLDESMTPTEKLTKENQGSELLENFSSINMILSGHQHRSFITSIKGVICSQPMHNGQNFARIVIDTDSKDISYELVDVKTLEVDIDNNLEEIFTKEHGNLQVYLDRQIGHFDKDIVIDNVFEARLKGHSFVNFLHQVQLSVSGADFSALSLFDNAIGFKKDVSIRDVLINYPYPNTLKVLKIKGSALKEAIEKSATYFVINNNSVDINTSFLIPKKQNYNYDMYGGLNYEIDLRKDFYNRVTSMNLNNEEIDLNSYYTIVLNNYRASNTAVYSCYEGAEIVKEINFDVSELIIKYFENHPIIKVIEKSNFIIKY